VPQTSVHSDAHWGWASSVGDFLNSTSEKWLASLTSHHSRIFAMAPSKEQVSAWKDEHQILFGALKECVLANPATADHWSAIFEYELPMEGGRRPDVVVLAGQSVVVLEFKSSARPSIADIDQTVGYVRDLHDYHSGSRGHPCNGVLVLAGATGSMAEIHGSTPTVGRNQISQYLHAYATDGTIDLEIWLAGQYEPLPMLVEAARRIFRDEELPHVKTAIAAGIPETVDCLGSIVDQTEEASSRSLAFVTGVPGAGKTLVGLRLVHERTEKHGRATFLSGNGPLVQVLQDALQSKVFVRDLHQFIKTYALNKRLSTPEEHVIVFDEAQRAWDQTHMAAMKGVERSEPDLLLEIGARIDKWSALVGLVGEGQEIHSGEEGGISQWGTAALKHDSSGPWTIHCAPKLANEFPGLTVVQHEELDLNVTLRSRRAEDLHKWVRLLLEGSIPLAHQQGQKALMSVYPIYVTRSLDDAKQYVRDRYKDEPLKRFGLLASSHARNLVQHGVDNEYLATSRMNIAKWYNADGTDPKSSNALNQPVTEFGCQGLELDMPILCWGNDYRWSDDRWLHNPRRRRQALKDPRQILINAYRVLLTRGRDGLIIYVPPESDLDGTEVVLIAAGAQILSSEVLDPVSAALPMTS
jgi:hypothetical protein